MGKHNLFAAFFKSEFLKDENRRKVIVSLDGKANLRKRSVNVHDCSRFKLKDVNKIFKQN